ncbi:methionine aminopeptidase 1 [bacterium BMS3Abin02]|nr:methionine aminopeptidase 1 [bacterium BMS3Abin02]GBE21276.1 methionine aminopeptidase 1 [bacterium BMS3Bbin01]HDH25302.1 type I methionyl aminopeptidase [Actinomycetota bacterium]HDK44741.1 type I methionyl aminopeptidase [Actinomycetota bacterium]
MITIKNAKEFDKMRVAGAAVAAVLSSVGAVVAPGVTLKELDELAAEIIRARGCTPSFLGYHGYPAHICTSPNDVIVHGIPCSYRLVEGDILSIDAGAIYQGYHGDAAATFAIGEVAKPVRRLIDTTRAALWAGIEQVREGARVGDIGHAVEQEAKRQGLGVVREYLGHGIGRQMHEDPQIPNYGTRGTGLKLRRGMSICIEPMFNMGGEATKVESDGWTVKTADGSLSAHFEHTIALTDGGVRVLTQEPDLVEGAHGG